MAPFKSFEELIDTGRSWAETGPPGRSGPFRHETLSGPLVFRAPGRPDLEIDAVAIFAMGPEKLRESLDAFSGPRRSSGDASLMDESVTLESAPTSQPVRPAQTRKGEAIDGRWYWVHVHRSDPEPEDDPGSQWFPALRDSKWSAGGWTNSDTWEDFDGDVDDWSGPIQRAQHHSWEGHERELRLGPWLPRLRCVDCLRTLQLREIHRSLGVCPRCGRSSGGDIVETVKDAVREIRDELRPWWAFWRGPRIRVSFEPAIYYEVGAVYDEGGDLLGHLGTAVRQDTSAFVWPCRSSGLLDPVPDWEDKYIHHRIERRDERWTCPPGSVGALAARRDWNAAEGRQ